MALTPVQFQRPRRDPSLIEQAFIGTLANIAQSEFITKPAERRARGFATSERLGGQEFITGERLGGQEFLVGEREAGVKTAKNAATLAHERRLAEIQHLSDVTIAAEESGKIPLSVVSILGGDLAKKAGVDFDPDTPGIQFELPEGISRRAGESVLDRLLNKATLVQREKETASVEAERQDRFIADILNRHNIRPENLSPVLVQDVDPATGEPTLRFPTSAEQTLRGVSSAAEVGALAGYETDVRVRGMLDKWSNLEPRLVAVPSYSPEVENEWLGRFSRLTPGSENVHIFEGIEGALQAGGFSSQNDRGEGRWFINDEGKRVETRTYADFLSRFPNEAQSRIRGALWARLFFQDPSKFDIAKQQYGLYDNVAEETYRAITAGQAPPPPPPPTVVGDLAGTEHERTTSTPSSSLPPPATAAARRIEDTGKFHAEALTAYTQRFLDDPDNGYASARAEVERLSGLSDDEFRSVLQSQNLIATPAPAVGTGYGGFSPAINPTMPDRDKLLLDLYAILNAANAEAESIRRRRMAQVGTQRQQQEEEKE